MSWTTIARRERSLTVNDRAGRYLFGLLIVAVLLAGYVYPIGRPGPVTTDRFAGFVSGVVTTIVPLVGIVLSYNAVASRRESGALLLSLSLPYSRRDLVVGTLVGRTSALAASLLVAMAGAALLVVYPFGELVLVPFLAFLVATLAFAAVWTGLGVAISLTVATKQRARVLGFGLFFLFVVAWDGLAGALEVGLSAAGLIDGGLPGPLRFLVGMEPGHVFQRFTAGVVDPGASVGGPWYLNEWIALVLLGLWVVVPLGLATRRFARSDLP